MKFNKLLVSMLIITLLSQVAFSVPTLADIHITSSNYHVWGNVSGGRDGPESYDFSGSEPISASVGEYGPRAWSSAAEFSVGNGNYEGSGSASSGSSAEWIFQSTNDGLFKFDSRSTFSWYTQSPFLSLTDLTTSDSLLSTYFTMYDYVNHYSFDLTSGHEYRLYITASGSYGDDSSLRLDMQPIPAPDAMMLGTIGFGFVGWLRRRKAI